MWVFFCASVFCRKKKHTKKFLSPKLFYFGIKTAVGTTKWVDIKYKLMQPNLPKRQYCSAVFFCFSDYHYCFFCSFAGNVCRCYRLYGLCNAQNFGFSFNAYHLLLAVHTNVSVVHYSNFGRDFVAVSGFSCSKSLQLTAYLCTSTENAFRNFWDEM